MELADLGKTPISQDSPTGSDVRYEPEFEELQAEIDKLSSPTAQAGPDWKKVVEISSGILQEKAKDLLVASYLVAGLMQTRQMDGLSVGLNIFADLLETFWENLFPPKKRMRGRRAAIEWLADRIEAIVGQMENAKIAPDKAQEISESLNRIEAFLAENLDEAPSFASIGRFIEEHKEEIPAQQAPPQKGPEPEAPSAQRPAPEPAPAEEITSAEDAKRTLKSVMQKVKQAAGYLAEANPVDPLPYRLRRLAIWALVDVPPPAMDGKTKIPPPPAQVKGVLEKLFEEQNWESLVKAAEARIGEFIYWLDLHFYAGQALSFLGDQYERAYDALCKETAHFVQRVSGIESMQFSDGTPFASEQTQKWLREISLGGGAVIAEESYWSEAKDQQALDMMAEEIKKAKTLVKKRKLMEAISLLQDHMRSSFSGRERLLWQLGICQVLVEGKKAFMALPHMDQILHNIDTYNLEYWEPELALRAMKIAWAAFQSSTKPEHKAKAEEVLARIARLDATEALKIKKKG